MWHAHTCTGRICHCKMQPKQTDSGGGAEERDDLPRQAPHQVLLPARRVPRVFSRVPTPMLTSTPTPRSAAADYVDHIAHTAAAWRYKGSGAAPRHVQQYVEESRPYLGSVAFPYAKIVQFLSIIAVEYPSQPLCELSHSCVCALVS